MKTQILKSIFLGLLFIAFCLLKAEAQIIYTDVNPDQTYSCNASPCSHSYNLDLNNDSVIDFTIRESYTIQTCFPSGTYSRKSVTASATGSNKLMTSMLNLNEVIGSNLVFSSSSGTLRSINFSLHYCAGSSGVWTNSTDHYLPLRLSVNSNIYYGWVRLNVAVTGPLLYFTVKDYAYNAVANASILAGEMSCTIPTVTLNAGGPLSFCNGDSVVLNANTTAYKFQWTKGGVNISGATKQTYVARTAGVYKCKVTNSCGSKTSGGKTVTIPCRNTNEIFSGAIEKLSVDPNPAKGFVTIKIPSDEQGEIKILNLFGQIVYAEKISSEQLQIDISRFPVGMYLVQWSNGIINETKIFSVVK